MCKTCKTSVKHTGATTSAEEGSRKKLVNPVRKFNQKKRPHKMKAGGSTRKPPHVRTTPKTGKI